MYLAGSSPDKDVKGYGDILEVLEKMETDSEALKTDYKKAGDDSGRTSTKSADKIR